MYRVFIADIARLSGVLHFLMLIYSSAFYCRFDGILYGVCSFGSGVYYRSDGTRFGVRSFALETFLLVCILRQLTSALARGVSRLADFCEITFSRIAFNDSSLYGERTFRCSILDYFLDEIELYDGTVDLAGIFCGVR